MRVIVVHYHEIALKAGNRGFFIGRLMGNLRKATGGTGVHGIQKQSGRVILKLRRDADWTAVRARVREVFGVANFALAARVNPRLPDLERAVREGLTGRTFESAPGGSGPPGPPSGAGRRFLGARSPAGR